MNGKEIFRSYLSIDIYISFFLSLYLYLPFFRYLFFYHNLVILRFLFSMLYFAFAIYISEENIYSKLYIFFHISISILIIHNIYPILI